MHHPPILRSYTLNLQGATAALTAMLLPYATLTAALLPYATLLAKPFDAKVEVALFALRCQNISLFQEGGYIGG